MTEIAQAENRHLNDSDQKLQRFSFINARPSRNRYTARMNEPMPKPSTSSHSANLAPPGPPAFCTMSPEATISLTVRAWVTLWSAPWLNRNEIPHTTMANATRQNITPSDRWVR